MVKFELKNLDESLFSQKMRDVFKSLVDVDVSYPQKDMKMGYLKSIPSNYGYVFFWFGFLDEEALSKHYKDYVSKEKLREIEEARIKEGQLFSFRDHIYDNLFPIVYDHSDVIIEGFAEVYLALLDVEFKEVNKITDKAIASLKRQAKKLEKLKDFYDKVFFKRGIEDIEEIELNYGTIKYADLKFERELEKVGDLEVADIMFDDPDENYAQYIHHRNGWEICLRIIFNGDDTLKEVVDKIDKIISPLKKVLNKMVRYESSFFPF